VRVMDFGGPMVKSSGPLTRSAVPFTTIPDRPRTDILTYEVQPGDTVFGIAEKFGIKPETIMWSNPVLEQNPDLLRIGDKLVILPVDGVYACWVTFPPATVPHGATISIGDNPTFDDVTDRRVEAFVHDFDGDLYGAEVEFTVHSWLRGMFRCESLDELIEKTAADVAASRIALAQPARRP